MGRHDSGRVRLLVTSIRGVQLYRHRTHGGSFCDFERGTVHGLHEVNRRVSGLPLQRHRHTVCTGDRFSVITTACFCCMRLSGPVLGTLTSLSPSRIRRSATRCLGCLCGVKTNNTVARNAPRRVYRTRFSVLVHLCFLTDNDGPCPC